MGNCYKLAIAVVVLLFITPLQASEPDSVKAIVGATVVDLDGKESIKDAVVLIKGERISDIGSADDIDIPATAEIINAQGMWLIPGLMNMHTHPGIVFSGKMAIELANESEAALALRMAATARDILLAGITTIRIPGDQRHADFALKKAIAKGQVIGPRIFTAGESLVITAGHGSEKGQTYSDGPYELMKAARKQISAGASWVKILISGGISTVGTDITKALMTPEEISAVIDVAHRFGVKVAAHSGSSEATSIAVDAGIDSIEHGYALDRKVLKKMKKHGTWLVPTILVTQPAMTAFTIEIGAPPIFLKRRDMVAKHHWKALQMAIEEGVNIALGTDQAPHWPTDGTTATAREAQYYVEAGMTPLQALRAATIEPAKMLGAEARIGSLAIGKFADILAVPEDPALSIKAIDNIVLVMKGGTVHVDRLENSN